MSIDYAKIMALLQEGIKIKDEITAEIQKEKDAKKRKELWKAMDEVLANPSIGNIAAFRKLLYKV